jgi:hypothetical protein
MCFAAGDYTLGMLHAVGGLARRSASCAKAAAAIAASVALAALWTSGRLDARPSTTQTIRRHFTPADRERGRYQYVSFDVPDGLSEITIAYRYDTAAGASVIDLGVIEPGPLTLGATTFRGYSGGATRTVTIGRDHSTPGYLAGPIPAGQWHVLLGLYKVAPGGVDVDIDITLGAVADSVTWTDRVRVGEPPTVSGPRWFSGGLHLHTNHSDGTIDPNALAAAARDAGLDFIAITDHNNTTHRHEPAASATPLRIVGEEITTPAGHANAWGLRPGALIDFRVRPEDPGAGPAIDGLVTATHAAGALFSINHPFGDCAGCAWQQKMPASLDAIEIWNGKIGPQPEAVRLWDRLLAAGRRVTAVGASDWHRAPDPIDAPSVRVFASGLTERDVLSAIKNGHVIVMRNARDEPPVVAASCGANRASVGAALTCPAGAAATVTVTMPGPADARVDLVWNGDTIASKPSGAATFALPAGAGCARVHVVAADGSTIAVTNPVYVTRR